MLIGLEKGIYSASCKPDHDIGLPIKQNISAMPNIWNIKSSKERLDILEKTHSQQRHLWSLLTAKSKVDDHIKLIPRVRNMKAKREQSAIQKHNESICQRIVNIDKLRRTQPEYASSGSLTRSLMNYSQTARQIKLKCIVNENKRFYVRLVHTSPTINRAQWQKRAQQTNKYKENLTRSKYARPDFSEEACKILVNQSPKFRLLEKFKSVKVRTLLR